ncbi:WecB/TagA/CpsF family glycosyltransferase [Methylomonas sp. AM2-LC]|uniref:WecB/TagA/CpsF family glycosyltransferase n=1 Tax=Methylomonas sp. AM2-LC TaxID=3153301 RepID=UPI00326717B3
MRKNTYFYKDLKFLLLFSSLFFLIPGYADIRHVINLGLSVDQSTRQQGSYYFETSVGLVNVKSVESGAELLFSSYTINNQNTNFSAKPCVADALNVSNVACEDFIYSVNAQSFSQIAANNTTSASALDITPVPLPSPIFLFSAALTGMLLIARLTQRSIWIQPGSSTNVLGIKFSNLNYDQALNLFQQWIISKVSHQVCFANVHTVVSTLEDKELLNINHKSFNAMDGLPLVWYAKLVQGDSTASRLCGPDLMLKCLDEGRNKNWTHFFLGGTGPILNDLVDAMQQRYPGVAIVGWHSPPFRALTEEEDQQLVDIINAANPDFLWVGLGAPKQEKWIATHLHRINVPVQLGVGAAFNFHSGHLKRAPRWMQSYGLEWAYRLMNETRLVRRYLATNPVFLLLFLRDLLLIRFFRLKTC